MLWRLIVVVLFFVVFIYYITLILHLSGIIRIGDKLGFKSRYLIPFVLWIE